MQSEKDSVKNTPSTPINQEVAKEQPPTPEEEILTQIATHGTIDKDAVKDEQPDDFKQNTPASTLEYSEPDLADFEEESWASSDSEILAWVDEKGVEYKSADTPQTPKENTSHRRVKKAQEYRVDLHGLRKEGALRRLKRVFASAKAEGCGQILIIHGRGNHTEGGQGVLKAMVYELLETDFADQVASYGFAPPNEGGGGATRVVLR